jgi:hypothetical protein
MIERLHRLDVTRLAADYSQAVRGAHSEAELKAIRDRNAAEPLGSRIDHVHDFTDANDLLAEAVLIQMPHVDDWADLADEMADASTRAKASGFNLSRILLGCEYSGTVRDAFAARGHSVMSCDILPTESPGPHYQGDVRDILTDGWHMAIFHPPCTYIAACQLWRCQPKHDPSRQREAKRLESLEFVRDLGEAPIEKVCVENPKSCIGTAGVLPGFESQMVQPNRYGHDHSKETYLWRRGLPKLLDDPADHIAGRDEIYKGKPVKRWANQTLCGADRMGPSANRGHLRSKFFEGIANAMADQWGGITAKLTAKATVIQLELFA